MNCLINRTIKEVVAEYRNAHQITLVVMIQGLLLERNIDISESALIDRIQKVTNELDTKCEYRREDQISSEDLPWDLNVYLSNKN